MASKGTHTKARFGPSAEDHGGWQCRSVHSVEQIWPVVDEVAGALAQAGFGPKQVFAARLALEEAISNGVRHGNGQDPRKVVKVRFHIDEQGLQAEVEDEGPGFNPTKVPDPLAPENLEREGGRGILLIRRYMTQAEYNDRGNCLRLALARSA
jgi:serine/threonine-protein kinase RsbW